MADIIHFTRANFDSTINGNLPVLVDFWASWCGPCRMVAPVVESLADRYTGRMLVGKVDVDSEPELAGHYGVMSIPTIILFKDGQEVKRMVGAMPEEAYADVLDKLL